jgi:hypothetical protein
MNTKIKFLFFIAFIFAIFSSCFEGVLIEGNNESAEEIRPFSTNFLEIVSSGSFNVYYAHGDSSSIRIEAESNLIPYIETYLNNRRLEISFARHFNIRANQDIDIYVTSPSISKIQLSGSGKIEADSVSGNRLEIDVSGSGNIKSNFYGDYFKSTISGSGDMNIVADCDTIKTEVSGSGNINLEAYYCKIANVSISGSGEAELYGSSNKATFRVVGSGKISAYEFPVNEANVSISGDGEVYINVSEILDAVLSGSGDLYYKGSPVINSNISGSGDIHNEN